MTTSTPLTMVIISNRAERQLRKIPGYIQESLRLWVETVERIGIRKTRMHKGYHDEPLMGKRKGQRSIRLNKAYRAIYQETTEGLQLLVIGVNKHEY
jgi:toxin HigB-1